MCASYGLGGGPREAPLPNDLPPLDEREHQLQLHEWATAQNSQARLTGVHARNFNPVIHMSDGERALAFGWWWLWRGHEKLPYSAFNARAETLVQRWYAPFQHRGLLPATWYVEKGATFSLPEDETMGLAAIITVTTEPNGDPLLSPDSPMQIRGW